MKQKFSRFRSVGPSRGLLGVGFCLLALLPANLWAHGEIAGAGEQNIVRLVEGKGNKYRVELMHSPALPTAGEATNIALKVMRLLAEPDPVLGSEVGVGLQPEGSLVSAESQKVIDSHLLVHGEGEAGIFGAEYRFPDSGSFLLRFLIHTETGDQLTVEFPVTVQTNVAAFFRLWVNLAVSVLILGLTGMQLWKVRARGGRLPQMLRPLSVGAVSWIVVLLLMNFFVLDQVLAMRKPKVVSAAAEAVTVNEDGSYKIPAAIQKELGILLVPAKQMALEQSFSAFGTVEPRPSHMAEVQAPLWGRIEFAKRPLAVGDHVERGQELVQVILELSQVERAPMEAKQQDIKGALRQAKERKEAAQLEYERAQKLFAANPAFEQDLKWAKELLDEANDTYQQISQQDQGYVGVIKFRDPRKTPVVAPVSGTITSIDFIPGQLDLNGEYRKLFTIVDTSVVWVRGSVYLSDAGKLKIGQPVLVYAEKSPDRPLRGTVHYIDDKVDPANRTLTVLVDVPNPQQQLVLGNFVRMDFQIQRQKGIVVPEQAVMDDGTRKRVYVAREQEKFVPVEVEVGIARDGWRQVLSGLEEGDRVIAKGAALLGSLRQEGPSSAVPSGGSSPEGRQSSELIRAKP